MFGKRGIIVAILLFLTPALTGSEPQHAAAKPSVTLVYVGARDCSPCRLWHRDYLPRFTTSYEFANLTYRAILAPKLFTLMDDANWPTDLRQYRERLDLRSAVPLWFVLVQDKVVLVGMGLGQWDNLVVPSIRSLLR